MNKKIIIFASTFAALVACSESEKVVGGTIEDQNAASDKQVREWLNFGTEWNESSYAKFEGGRSAVSGDGNGGRVECVADSASLAMTMQIYNSSAVSTMSGNRLVNSCDSVFAEFKAECDKAPNSEFYTPSNGCKDGAFEAVCLMKHIASDSANKQVSGYIDIAMERCNEMTRNARSSSWLGGMSMSSSSTELDGSSSSIIIEEVPEIEPVRDTAITVNYNSTLENYVLQFAENAEQLSFDEHVIAYNGSPDRGCSNYAKNITNENPYDVVRNTPMVQMDTSDIWKCFPMTAKILDEHPREANCRYFMTLVGDGSQPTGHVLSRIAGDTLEFTSVTPSAIPGGYCMATGMFFSVFFLIEDCENEFNPTAPEGVYNSFKSELWKCGGDDLSGSSNVGAYGEWFNGKLIEN